MKWPSKNRGIAFIDNKLPSSSSPRKRGYSKIWGLLSLRAFHKKRVAIQEKIFKLDHHAKLKIWLAMTSFDIILLQISWIPAFAGMTKERTGMTFSRNFFSNIVDSCNNASKDPNDYRECVGIILLNKDGKVFVGRRYDFSSESWQLPQGGVDNGENLKDAALREMLEEIGTDNAEFLYESPKWYYYDIPMPLASTLWGGRYKGQRQKWFLFRFTGKDKDINIHTKHPEFQEWRWEDLPNIVDLAVPFKRDVYKEVIKDFAPIIAGLI